MYNILVLHVCTYIEFVKFSRVSYNWSGIQQLTPIDVRERERVREGKSKEER